MRCWLFRHKHRVRDSLLTALAYGKSYRCGRCNRLVRYPFGHARPRNFRRTVDRPA